MLTIIILIQIHCRYSSFCRISYFMINSIFAIQLEEEVLRRQKLQEESWRRRQLVASQYTQLNPNIFTLQVGRNCRWSRKVSPFLHLVLSFLLFIFLPLGSFSTSLTAPFSFYSLFFFFSLSLSHCLILFLTVSLSLLPFLSHSLPHPLSLSLSFLPFLVPHFSVFFPFYHFFLFSLSLFLTLSLSFVFALTLLLPFPLLLHLLCRGLKGGPCKSMVNGKLRV